jgi:hypothetical protein
VTAVLIGEHTAQRRWVRYELQSSLARGNGIVGVFIHGIKNQNQEESSEGRNPLDDMTVRVQNAFLGFVVEEEKPLSQVFKTYYWRRDEGNVNLPAWIEEAAEQAKQLASMRAL